MFKIGSLANVKSGVTVGPTCLALYSLSELATSQA